jgi:flagellar basal body L-ring protein FlgH
MKKLNFILSFLTVLFLIILVNCTPYQTIVKGECEAVQELRNQKAFKVTKEWTSKGTFPFAKKYYQRMDSFIPGSNYYYEFYTWRRKFNIGDTITITEMTKEDVNVKIRKIK